jgi:hypothetical protein
MVMVVNESSVFQGANVQTYFDSRRLIKFVKNRETLLCKNLWNILSFYRLTLPLRLAE